jgi:hypothetical protein
VLDLVDATLGVVLPDGGVVRSAPVMGASSLEAVDTPLGLRLLPSEEESDVEAIERKGARTCIAAACEGGGSGVDSGTAGAYRGRLDGEALTTCPVVSGKTTGSSWSGAVSSNVRLRRVSPCVLPRDAARSIDRARS